MKRDNSEGFTLQFLEKKYQEEKQILLKENRRLKNNLQAEIQRGDHLVLKNDQLQREVQNLNAIILELRNQIEDSRENQGAQEAHRQLIKQYQETVRNYNKTLSEKGELETLIQQIYNEKIGFEKELQEFRANESELQSEMQALAEKHCQFKTQSTKQIQQLLSLNKRLEDQLERANSKSSDQRKKSKELEKKMIELEKRLQISEELEEKKYAEQLEELRMERDKLYQKNLELNTKCSLFQSKIAQLEKHQEHLEDEIKSAQRKIQAETDKTYEYRNKLDKQQKLIEELEQEIEKLKQQNKELEQQKNTIPRQDFMKQMRKNLTDINELSHKNLQKIGEGPTLRDYPSQSQFGVFIKQDDGLERAKLQGQINSLESEIVTYKKQIQIITDQLRKLKRINEDRQHQIERKQIQIRELRQKIQKQAERGKQLLALRKENQNLRGKETQMIQRAKEVAEYETSMSLKLAFYQRKIKENLDSIDRKESIIQKHKTTLIELEERQKHYEEALKRLNDEVQSLKGYKQECNRKDTLLKEYKAKNQKMKEEKEDSAKEITKLKTDISKLRNDKQRFQTQLQIKQKQLSSLKAKHEKLSSEKTDEYYKQNTRLKENKNANDHKIKQLKRQKEELSEALQQIRSIIINKVEEYIAKQIPTGRKKGHQYEAAKLLGLKAGDLEEFLNPGANMSRRISVDLQQLWMEGNFIQFTNSFINYIITQAQRKDNQT